MNILKWLVPWEPSALVVVCTLLAVVLYARGVRGCRVATWPRQLAWWLGLALIYACVQTHLDYYAEHEFFIHRLQHLVLHHMGPFLIMLARPGVVLRRGLPVKFRSRVWRPFLRWPPVRMSLNFLFHPLVASVLFVGLIYFWLYSPIHFIAMLDVRLYKLMNYSMVVDGLLFWWLVLDKRPHPPAHLSPGVRIFIALAVVPPQIVAGAYITFVQANLFPIYAVCGRVIAGLSPLADQRIGGLLIWVPASMMSAVAALIALHAWMKLDASGRLNNKRSQAIRAEATRQRREGEG